MLLQPSQVVAYCLLPAATADLAVGRALERRHRLHLDGTPQLLETFLTTSKPSLLASPDAWKTLLEVMKPATKALYGGCTEVLDKIFTAPGGTRYFEFTDPSYSDDFQAFLADTARAGDDFFGQFAMLWKKQSLTGFQGVFLADLPPVPDEPIAGIAGVPSGLPAPFIRYVPSASVWDICLTGNRVEYLILSATDPDTKLTEYYCWDDAYCHRVQSVGGQLTYQLALRTTHGLAYVPACPVTTLQPDPTRPVLRTSLLEKSLDLGDVYLTDFNEHELGKRYHAFPQKWSYGIDCDYVPYLGPAQYAQYGAEATVQACVGGYCATSWQGQYTCPKCNGAGKYIPVGPDKVYIVKSAPEGQHSVVNPGPAGYVVPDLTSLEYLGGQLVVNEEKIEKAVLGKSGLLQMQTKAESGIKALTDLSPLTGRLDARGQDSLVAEKFLADTLARLRYGSENYKGSNITRGGHYHFFSVDVLMQAFADAKKNGADAGYLYSLLEDIIYAKYGDDPMELERNLLKLELTPAPHLTVQEAGSLGIVGVMDLLQKTFLNNFIARFERENGSILDFGSALSHQLKIERIQAQLTIYGNEKRSEQLPVLFAGRATLNPTATGDEPGAQPAAVHAPANAGAGPAAQPPGVGAGAAAGGS